jgi:MSHA biogenesis protein MshL
MDIRRWQRPVAALATLLLAACAGQGGSPLATTRIETAPPPPAQFESLPSLPVSQVDRATESWPRVESLDAVNEELRTVLRGVAEQYGLDYRIHPAVEGRVTTRLRNATLREVLDALVLPHGYTYQLDREVLRVEPARLTNRMFSLDFLSISRVGVGSTVVQRRLGGAATGLRGAGVTGVQTGSQGVPGAGADVITSVAVTDLWEDMRVALEGLIFSDVQSPEQAGIQRQQPTGAMGGVGGRAPQTTSRVSEDGRRLIVNPMAGSIMVTASPRVLEEVDLYLTTVQTAVQRQVRIEAKFVEVILDRQFEFGIDWGAVQSFGDFRIELRSAPATGGLEFRLDRGESAVSAILDALDRQGDVRVLSSPGVSTLNNQRAVFNVTTEEVFFAVTRQPVRDLEGRLLDMTTQVETQPIAVGIVMDVLPQISEDNTITMNVRPMVTTLVRVEEFSQDGNFARAPVIDRRELDSMVRVRSGETHVIGGLIQTRQEQLRSGVPVLRHIPGLGLLFTRTRTVERRSELVIFITPTIIAGTAPVAP